jgi:DNA-binding NarL/FixJ family response regulator
VKFLGDREGTSIGVHVHLLSPHPFVLKEWVRCAPPGATFAPIRLLDCVTPEFPALETEPGAVVVLDACFAPATTESLAADLAGSEPTARLIVVMESLSSPVTAALLRLGVKGLLTYSDGAEALRSAIAKVSEGGMWVPRDLLSSFVDGLLARPSALPVPVPACAGGLSRREMDVLDALLQNLSNKEIGSRLNISERTVKFHVSNLLAKFSVQRRADLIVRSLGPVPAWPARPGQAALYRIRTSDQ